MPAATWIRHVLLLLNLLCCDAAIAQYLNRMSSCDVVLLDFIGAFDKVSHVILSRKLSEISI
jgi:hypothetical protein